MVAELMKPPQYSLQFAGFNNLKILLSRKRVKKDNLFGIFSVTTLHRNMQPKVEDVPASALEYLDLTDIRSLGLLNLLTIFL